MRWSPSVIGPVVALSVCIVFAKPGGQVTEERRAYYQKTSQVIDSPIIFPTNGELQSYTASNDDGGAYSTWAQSHMEAVKQMADRLRSEYNVQARGGAGGRKGYHRVHHGFSRGSAFDYPNFTGKSKEEMDAIARQITEQMISDMKSGKILYSQIAQPNWFENLAAQKLESLSLTQDMSSHQQQSSGFHQGGQDAFSVEGFRQTPQTFGGGYTRTSEKKHYEYSSSHGGYQPVLPTYATEIEDLTRRQEQSSVMYPTTITIIGGNRYVDKKNCTTSASNVAVQTPYVSTSRGHSSSIDEILEKGRTIPIVVEPSHSTYNKEVSSFDKQHEQHSVPVYPGSYFTGDQFDSQFSQSNTHNIPIQSQIQSQTSETRGKSRYNSEYEPIIFGGGSETVRQSSTIVRERENQQTPVVIPTQQTVTSSSDSYRQRQSQQYVPIVYPSSSTQQESSISNYESHHDHRPAPRPITTTSSHSIYKHLQKETESIPDYKPVVTIDSQMIESTNEELNKYYKQRPTTVIQTQETEHIEKDRANQQNVVIPEFTLTIHQQETEEGSKDHSIQQVRPTIATSQQTYTDDRQQSSVQYRPSYPAYGNQISRNDTEYQRNYMSQFPQKTATGSTYEKHEEDHYRTSEHQRTKPVYTQSSQNTEEISTSSSHREHQAPVIVGGSTDYQESHEDHFTSEYQRPIPEKIQTEQVNQTTQTSRHRNQQPLYVSGSSSQTIETDDQLRQSTRYRPYPTGHQTSQVSSETEDSYWQQHHSKPQSTVSSQSETESVYHESGRTRYPQTGLVTSQSSHEQESQQEDVRYRPGQPGYSVTTHLNDTTVSTSREETQQPFVTTAQQQTLVEESGSDQGSQIVIQPGYGETSAEINQSTVEVHDSNTQYPVGSNRSRDQSSYDYERQHQQGVYGGGTHLDRSEYGSQVSRNYSSGGGSIGYITQQMTIEQQEELWRRQQEERRRQQLITTGVIQESSSSQTSSYGDGKLVQVGIAQQGIYDGDETRLRNGTEHLDQSHYESTADTSSTYASGRPPGKIISKDRGDQPPQHYEEDYDLNENEPGIGNYPSEPQTASQVFEPSTTARYEVPYVAPLAPLPSIATDNDRLISNQQTTVEVYPGTAGETEVQRSYHRKKTTITQTIPVLLGPNGEVIQASVNDGAPVVIGSQQQIAGNTGSYQASSSGSHQSASGGYQSLLSGSSQSQRNTDGNVAAQLLAREREAQERDAWEQAYQSQSSSQQTAGQGNIYGSSVYGSEVVHTGQPDSSYTRGNRGRYTSGSSSQSVSYGDGGSYSQASAYGHQQQADSSLEELAHQHTDQSFEIDERQQSQDLTQQFVDDDEETEQVENLRQHRGYQSHGSYSQSTGEMEDYGQQTDDQSSSAYQQQSHHSSYSAQSSSVSSSSSSGGSYVAAEANSSQREVEPVPSEIQEEEETDQNKPGFWKRLGKKAKDLFG